MGCREGERREECIVFGGVLVVYFGGKVATGVVPLH